MCEEEGKKEGGTEGGRNGKQCCEFTQRLNVAGCVSKKAGLEDQRLCGENILLS